MAMSQGFISRALLIAFIAALAVVPLSILFFPHNQTVTKNDALLTKAQQDLIAMLSITPTPIKKKKNAVILAKPPITITPTLSKAPIAVIVESSEDKNTNTYTSSDGSFSFTYPQQWKVTDQKSGNLYALFFTSSNPTDIGQDMNIVVFNRENSVEEVIASNYPQFRNTATYQKYGTIGNKPLYKITLPNSGFGSIGLVLGQKHAYVISFDDNGNRTIIDEIEKQVWPSFKFE